MRVGSIGTARPAAAGSAFFCEMMGQGRNGRRVVSNQVGEWGVGRGRVGLCVWRRSLGCGQTTAPQSSFEPKGD